MSIDLVATQANYRAHLDPVWAALPDRGEIVGRARDRTSDAALVAGHQDLVRARRWGYSRIAYLEHGIGQSYGNRHPAYPGGVKRDAVGLFLSPNATAAAADRAAYPSARVELVGDPRLDTLPDRDPGWREGATVAISFHWGPRIAPETRPTLSHFAPALPELARRFNVIGHAHPRARGVGWALREAGIPFVDSFDDICRRADVYICDNSSTIFEFASTGRPVVLLNGPDCRRDVELGLRFWAAAGVGPHVDEPGELVDVVASVLAESPATRSPRLEAALAIAYAHRSGAGERAAAAIVDWLETEAIAA